MFAFLKNLIVSILVFLGIMSAPVPPPALPVATPEVLQTISPAPSESPTPTVISETTSPAPTYLPTATPDPATPTPSPTPKPGEIIVDRVTTGTSTVVILWRTTKSATVQVSIRESDSVVGVYRSPSGTSNNHTTSSSGLLPGASYKYEIRATFSEGESSVVNGEFVTKVE